MFKQIVQNEPSAASGKENKFVFEMNRVKYESMCKQHQNDQFLAIPRNFSMFNRHTEFPFDPIPNVLKLSPPDFEERD